MKSELIESITTDAKESFHQKSSVAVVRVTGVGRNYSRVWTGDSEGFVDVKLNIDDFMKLLSE